jgi:hypothetical protein
MATIYDYTEYKLHSLMEGAARDGHDELADWLYIVLNEYLTGNVAISFEKGMPIIIDPEP